MNVEADHERCVGAGMCVMAAPDVFGQDPGDGRVILLAEHTEPDQLDAVRDAVDLCPSGALSLQEEK